MKRISYLDGLRGLACLQVVAFHYARYFYATLPVGFPDDGAFAVALFFLLSGLVLTGSFERTDTQMAVAAVARVVRLVLPCLVVVVASVLIKSIDRSVVLRAAQAAHSSTLLAYSRPVRLADHLRDMGGYGLFFGFDSTRLFWSPWTMPETSSADPVTWTINYEIWGSLWVLALVRLRARSTKVYCAAIIVSILLFGLTEITLFTIGNLAHQVIKRDRFIRLAQAPVVQATGFSLIIIAIMAAQWLGDQGSRFNLLQHGILRHPSPIFAPDDIAAILLFTGVLLCRPIQNMLDQSGPRYLGKISFSIYLLHWPIMMVLGSTIFLSFSTWCGSLAGTIIAFVGGLAVTLPTARLFETYVDGPSVRLSRSVRKTAALRGARSCNKVDFP